MYDYQVMVKTNIRRKRKRGTIAVNYIYLSAGETQFFPIGDKQRPENRLPSRSSEIIPNLANFLPEHLFTIFNSVIFV